MAVPAFAPPAPPCTLRWEAYPPLSDEPDGDAVAALAATVADVVASTVADAGFLWHADPLTPRASTVVAPPWWPQARRAGVGAPSPPPPPCVWGETSFGDAVSDEWFVAALLVDVTRTVPGCVVRLWDDDGEFFVSGKWGVWGQERNRDARNKPPSPPPPTPGDFLLIEAAPALPRWLRPDTAPHRVWLVGGRVHIVPPEVGSPAAPLTVTTALAALRDPAVASDAGDRVHAALAHRLGGAVASARARPPHAARALLPRALAHALIADPGLATVLAAAYDDTDTDDLGRAARGAAAWGVGDLVAITVRLPRLRYASLASRLHAPPRGWPTPPVGDPTAGAADLGAKLAAAAEVVSARAPPPRCDSDATPTLTAVDVESLPGWHPYLAALLARGGLAGETPGSAAWQRTVGAAADRFGASAAARADADAHPGVRLRKAAAVDVSDEALAAAGAAEEGDLGWLKHGSAVADAFADVGALPAPSTRPRRGATAPMDADGDDYDDPTAIAARVRAFVDKVSSFEGATPLPPRSTPPPPSRAAESAESGAAATPPSGLNIDDGAFWEELGACLGVPVAALTGKGGDGDATSSDEGSSFYSGPPSDADSDDGMDGGADTGHPTQADRVAAEAARLRAVAAATGRVARGAAPVPGGAPPDSDDDPDDDDDGDGAKFAAAYEAELGRQLASTTLGATWEGGAGGDETSAATGAAPTTPSPLAPVDVDVNLVQSLLASYAGEGGLAGPASTLAGMLGVSLAPRRESDERSA